MLLLLIYLIWIFGGEDSSTASSKSSGNFLVDTLDSINAFSSDENMFYWALISDEEDAHNKRR